MNTIIHTLHVALAGVWLGGVVFTTMVVSPALMAMKWAETERVSVRSKIGGHYARVGGVNLILLALFAILDGLIVGFDATFYAEYALLVVLFGLVMVHGAYFGRRLARRAEAEKRAGSEEEAHTFAEKRRNLQKLSLRVSWADIVVSTAVVVLAVNVS
jgi:putative copper export protein